MKKSELRKLMVKERTNNKAIKEMKEITRYLDEYELNVGCFTSTGFDNEIVTDLEITVIDREENEYHTIIIATIEIEEYEDSEFWDLVEMTRDIFKTMKKNLVKDLESIGYEITSTEDYNQ